MHAGIDNRDLLGNERDEGPDAAAPGSWWERSDLLYRAGSLSLGGQDLQALAQSAGTPLYAYSGARVHANLLRIRNALASSGLAHRLFYAMKANRFEPLLKHIRRLGLSGADVCSPGELALALQCGFAEADISYTATSVSNADLDVLARHPGVWVNCDSLSSLRRLGERCPGREIGLRVNPALGIGYGANPLLRYAGAKPTKFGIYEAQFDAALDLAARFDLRVSGLHVHAGCGYLTPQLQLFDGILEAIIGFIERARGIKYVNVGGGLGSPLVAGDPTLDLDGWAQRIADRLGSYGVEIWAEPGDYIVKDAGVLVMQVNTVEEKGDTLFIGVDGGFNIHIEPAFYGLPLEVVPCSEPRSPASPPLRRVTVAGNINEALDLWAEDILLPDVHELDYLAFLNAGAYGSSMSSNHCMRGTYSECMVPQDE